MTHYEAVRLCRRLPRKCPGLGRARALVVVALLAVPLRAADPTLDELLNLAPPREAKPSADAPPPSQAGDPTEAIVNDMRAVSQRLGSDLDSGLQTQRMQEAILARIDQMIKLARQQQSSSSQQQQQQQQQQGSRQNAQQQQNQSQASSSRQQGDNRGETGTPPKADRALNEPLRQNRVEWGNLPPRVRDELLQGSSESFSPVYRELTEAYYRRLAEEAK